MPVRGSRSIWPAPSPKPTGIFSTRGSQKRDSTADLPHKGLMAYAHKHKRKLPKTHENRPPATAPGPMHQNPKRRRGKI